MSYQCPLCGEASNRKHDAFETPDAVVGHINAKNDPVHADEDGEDYRVEIDEVEDDPPENNTDEKQAEDSGPHSEDVPLADDGEESEDAVVMDPGEFDETIQGVAEDARSEGYREGIDDGYQTGKDDGYTEAVENSVTETVCPDCAGVLVYGIEGEEFHTQDGGAMVLTDTDGHCASCNLVIEKNGNRIYGANTETTSSGGWSTIIAGVFVGGVMLALVATGAISEEQADECTDTYGSPGGYEMF